MAKLTALMAGTFAVLLLAYSVLASSFSPLIDWLGPMLGFQLRFVLGLAFMLFGSPTGYPVLLISWAAVGAVIGLFARGLLRSLGIAFLVYLGTGALLVAAIATVFAPFFFGARPALPPVPPGTSFATLVREPIFTAAPGFFSSTLSFLSGAGQYNTSVVYSLIRQVGLAALEDFALLMVTAALVGVVSQRLISTETRGMIRLGGIPPASVGRLRALACLLIAALMVSTPLVPAAAVTTTHNMTISVTDSGVTYQVIIEVPSSNYNDEYSVVPYSSFAAGADKAMIADCYYVTEYLLGDTSDYPIQSAEVTSNGAIVSGQTASDVLASTLEYCKLLSLLGPNDAITYDSQQATNWNQDYQNQAFTANAVNTFTNVVYYASLIGPIVAATSDIVTSSGRAQLEAAVSLFQALTEGYTALKQQYPDQADSILSTLGLTEGYNPSALANQFLTSTDKATSMLAMVEQQDFGVTWETGISGEVNKLISAMETTTVDSLPTGAMEGLSAYFGAGLTLTTSVDVAVAAATESIAVAVPLALGSAILSSYDLPMAAALYNSWQETGTVANLFSDLTSYGQTFGDPTSESLPADSTTVTNAFYEYGIWETSFFFYYLNTYLYLNGEFLNPNANPTAALTAAQDWYKSAEQWQSTIEGINEDAATLLASSASSPIAISSGTIPSVTNNNLVPTIPAGDGFALEITGAKQATLTEGAFSFTVGDGQWSSSFLDSLFVVDPAGNWYLIVDNPTSGEGSVTTSPKSEIKLIDFQSSGSGGAVAVGVETTNAESYTFTIYGTSSESGHGYSESIVSLVNPDGSASTLYSFVNGSINPTGTPQSDIANSAFTLILAQSGVLNFLPPSLTSSFSGEAALLPQIILVMGYPGSCATTASTANQEATALQSSLGLSQVELFGSSPIFTTAILGGSAAGVGCTYIYYSPDELVSFGSKLGSSILPIIDSSGLINIPEEGLSSGFLIPGATGDSVNAIGLGVGFGNPTLLADLLHSLFPFASGSANPPPGLSGFAVAVTLQNGLVFSSSLTHQVSLSHLIGYNGGISFSPDSSSSIVGIGTPSGSSRLPFPLAPLTDYQYDILARPNSTWFVRLGSSDVSSLSAVPVSIPSANITATFTGLFPADLSLTKSLQEESNGTVRVQIVLRNLDTSPIVNVTISDSAVLSTYRGEVKVVSGSPDHELPSLMANQSVTYSYSLQLNGIGTYDMPPASLDYTYNGTSFAAQSNTLILNKSAPDVLSATVALFAAPVGALLRAVGISNEPAYLYTLITVLILLSLILVSCLFEYRSLRARTS